MSLPREWSFPASTAVSDMSVDGQVGCAEIEGLDTNQNALSGSLFSIHSAPVFELNVGTDSPKRPSSLVIPASGVLSEVNIDAAERLPPVLLANGAHISSPETVDDDDNLLTISSLTARPLIAKSRELRSYKAAKCSKWRRTDHDRINDFSNPVDGGYGWVIVFGAFFVQFWVAGLVKSYGVLFVEIMETYRDSSAAVASWIPAILSALCLALAPLSSALCEKFSCRIVVFVGGVFCALGLTLSYFATSLVHLFFTFGVLTGIGGGLSTTPGIVMVSQYFSRHRALANGICVSGTAAGSFVFPLLIERLCDTFGFHGTILLLGGCMLHVCVSATLYRPLITKKFKKQSSSSAQIALPLPPADSTRILLNPPDDGRSYLRTNKHLELIFINDQPGSTKEKIKNNILNDLFNNQNTMLIDAKVSDSDEEKDVIGETIFMKPIRSMRSSSILHSVEDLSTDSTCVYKSRQRDGLSRSMFLMPSEPVKDASNTHRTEPPVKPKKTWHQKITKYLDLSLLKNFKFIMMCLSVTLMSTGSPYMLYYLPAYVLSAGYTKSEAGYLVAISAAFDLCGRLGLGWLSDLQLFNRRKGYIGSIVGAGVAVLVIPVADSFYVLACAVGMYGLCLGCWFLLVPVLLADQFGTDKISSSYGLVRMFQSIGAISIPPLAGFMRDVTGGYEYCFYCMGTCMVFGGIPLLLVSDFVESDSDSSTSGKVSRVSTGSE